MARPRRPAEAPRPPERGFVYASGTYTWLAPLAGDSATSGMVLSLLAGATELEAAAVGNLVASITVQQIGTTGTATPQQVLQRWREMQSE